MQNTKTTHSAYQSSADSYHKNSKGRNMTDKQPEALRLAQELDAVPETGADPQTIQEAAAELRRLHAYCQELESHLILDCMTHVQNPAENEHVTGDVSKNGAELDMSAQQPAPAPQQEALEPLTDSQIMASIGRNAGRPNTSISESRPLGQQWDQVCNLVRDIFRERYAPAPQQEAQEQAAVVVPCHTPSGKRVALYSAKQDLPIGTQLYTAPQPSPASQGDALSDDAVRVPLDKLHADAAYLIGRLREGSMPHARVIEIIRERIDAAKAAIRARAPADSVLEDAARLDWLLLHISGAEFRRIGVHYSGNASRADVDAARKQGENHD